MGAAPATLGAALLSVPVGDGARPASLLALGSAAHVAALVAFAVVLGALMGCLGPWRAATAAALAYVVACVPLALSSPVLSVAVAAILVTVARVPGRPEVRETAAGGDTGFTGREIASRAALATLVVPVVVVLNRLAGPGAASAIAAFPVQRDVHFHRGPRARAQRRRRGHRGAARRLAGPPRVLPGVHGEHRRPRKRSPRSPWR